MNSDEFREMLESLGNSDLIRHIQKYVCLSLAEVNNAAAQSHILLDLVYAECVRRGKERLYDKVYESVCRKPQLCEVMHAA